MLGDFILRKTPEATLMKSLDAGMLRSRVIANNIANVNTPGYQRLEVKFEDELKKALDRTRLQGMRTDSEHLAIGRKDIWRVNAQVERPVDPSLASGVNNVDIDTEMAKLAENQILFNFSSNMVRGIYKKLNAAIQGRSIPVQ